MAKVFTIMEGLENLGALKSGGQGSVYKARRTGEIITAVKILPTPISSESDADKNFISFQNEVQKLRKVNESLCPNIVSIIASGITSSGNLPYIEMEYIDGPDLAELLTPPHDAVFTIKEVIKVADHLSNALAHCHRANVKHGDIKSNNVKFNQRTGNYMLLDFGLSVMSDEQRRTSIRYAGAVEFMAPEQSDGEMLFETDVYSFGIILFELLSGSVPFPLYNKGEMARNAVMVAHMEAPPPDLLSHRRLKMPDSWSIDKKEREMTVPAWLLQMIARCLEKSPGKRFTNGEELQDFIHSGVVAEQKGKELSLSTVGPKEIVIVSADESKLKEQIHELELQANNNERLVKELKYQIEVKDNEICQLNLERYNMPKNRGISKGSFFMVFALVIGLVAYGFYDYFIKPNGQGPVGTPMQANSKPANAIDSSLVNSSKLLKRPKGKPKKTAASPLAKEQTESPGKLQDKGEAASNDRPGSKYKIIKAAYFYLRPEKSSRSNYYVYGDNVILTSLNEKNDFIYVEFINSAGKNTKGWLAKKDLSRAYE